MFTNFKASARLVGRVYDAALEPLGLNVAQYAVLAAIVRLGPVRLLALADDLRMERTTLYRALAIMEKNGWLAQRALGGGRAAEVALTPAGQALAARARQAWEREQAQFTASFGAKRWDAFLETLDAVNAHFEAREAR